MNGQSASLSADAARVTVIIPAFRAEDSIEKAITSVLDQEVAAKVIVVVDGDLDRTAAIVRGLGSARVECVVNPANKGAQYCRNLGLERTGSELVMFLDGDDYVLGPLLPGLVEVFIDHAVDIGFGPWRRFHVADGRLGPIHQPAYASSADLFHQWLAEEQFVPPCSVMWRTDYLRQIGGWSPKLKRNQDGELVLRAVLAGARFAISTQGAGVWVNHAHEGSVSSRTDLVAEMLVAPEMLLDQSSDVIGNETRRAACAEHFYNIALHCFKRGKPDTGAAALARARSLGFRGHKLRRSSALMAELIGMRAFFAVRQKLSRRR